MKKFLMLIFFFVNIYPVFANGNISTTDGQSVNTYLEKDGTLVFSNDSIVWDDVRVPLTAGRIGTTNPPSFEAFIGTVFQHAFEDEAVNEDEIYFTLQMPHAYKIGTDIHPHVHWAPKENPADTSHDVVRWGLEYEWQDNGDTFAGTTSITVDAEMDAVSAKELYQTDFGVDISGAGISGMSSILVGRLYRNSSHANDTYDSKSAFAIEIDFHYQIDTIGSRTEGTK